MKRGAKKRIPPAWALAAVCLSGGFTQRSASAVGYAETGGRRSWPARCSMLDGSLRRTLHPGDAQSGFHVEAVTEGGSLRREMTDAAGRSLFAADDIASSRFGVEASGKALVYIGAADRDFPEK